MEPDFRSQKTHLGNTSDRNFSFDFTPPSSKIKLNISLSESNCIAMARKRVSENPVVMSPGAGAAPARRSSVSRRVTRTTPAVETAAVEAETAAVEAVDVSPVPAAPVTPSREEIASLAYSYWVDRGYQGGSPEQDWLRAEQELCSKYAR
jgi:hypothetical protein